MFINDAYAAEAAAAVQGTPLAGTLIQLALIFLIFYFVLIRPQYKKMREHAALVEALKVGDKVLLTSGIYGKISKIKEDKVYAEIAPNVEILIDRMTVGAVINDAPKAVVDGLKAEKANKKVKKGK